MPQAIAYAAAAVANWAASAAAGYTVTGYGAAAAAGAYTAAAYVVAYGVTYAGLTAAVVAAGNAAVRAQLPDVEGQKVTRKQTRPERCWAVGGYSRMSGPYMLRRSEGNRMAAVIALHDGRLAGFGQFYLNSDKVTVVGNWVQGQEGERYGTGDLVQLHHRLGAPTETHYGFLTEHFGAHWPTTARGDGVASLAFIAQHRSRESVPRHFPNGEPLPSAVGAPVCYDWRDETQDRLDESTWKLCANPVVWLVHVEWYRHGRNWDRAIAPVLDALTEEADVCDAAGEGYSRRYQVAGNYPVPTERRIVRQALVDAMDGWMSTDGKGRLVVKAGRYVAPTFTLEAEDIRGFTWEAFQLDEEAINELIVSYVSPAHDYSEIEAGRITDEADILARGRVRSAPFSQPWVTNWNQVMRLGRRTLKRLCAERRGTVRTNMRKGRKGMGHRFIRVRNPRLTSMADVVVEVMKIEIDAARDEVVFHVVLADPTIDDDETVPGTAPAPPSTTPWTWVSPRHPPAVTPTEWTVWPPTTSTDDTITMLETTAVLPDGGIKTLPAGSVTGLDPSTVYGVFWREDDGYAVAPRTASADYMATGGWVFVGWQATSDALGDYPPAAPAPGGWAGSGPAPTLVEM